MTPPGRRRTPGKRTITAALATLRPAAAPAGRSLPDELQRRLEARLGIELTRPDEVPPAPSSEIAIRARAPIAHVVLERPAPRAPGESSTGGALAAVLLELGRDAALRAVVLSGEGVACPAGDLVGDAPDGPRADALAELLAAIEALARPVILVVDGPVGSGGVALMTAVDLVVASDDAIVGTGGTGRPLTAAEAHALGLVDHVIEAADLEATSSALAAALAERGPAAVARELREGHPAADVDLAAARRFLLDVLGECLDAEDVAAGVAAFLARRARLDQDRLRRPPRGGV